MLNNAKCLSTGNFHLYLTTSRKFIRENEYGKHFSFINTAFIILLVTSSQFTGADATSPLSDSVYGTDIPVGYITSPSGNTMEVDSNGRVMTPEEASTLFNLYEGNYITREEYLEGIRQVYSEPASVSTSITPSATSISSESIRTEKRKSTEIAYSSSLGYVPAQGDPISIQKVITPKDSILGGQQRVYVEITNLRRELNDIDIRELVDDDFRIVPQHTNNSSQDSLVSTVRINNLDKICRSTIEFYKENNGLSPSLEGNSMEEIPTCENDKNISSNIITIGYLLFNWDDIFNNQTNGREKLLAALKNNFEITWADIDHANITLNGTNKSVIEVNHIEDNTDWAKLQVKNIDEINREGKVILSISDGREYDLLLNVSKEGIRCVYDWNNILELHVRKLLSKEKFGFWYYIKPKRSGIFGIESIARISDNAYSAWPDITYPLDIEVKAPDMIFNIEPRVETYNVYANSFFNKWIFNEYLEVNYNITCIGNALRPQYYNNIEAKLPIPNRDRYYVTENGTCNDKIVFNLNFSQQKIQNIPIRIRYNKSGTYRLPMIFVEGGKNIFKDAVITVDDPITRNKEQLGLFVTLITFLLGTLLGRHLGLWERVRKICKRDPVIDRCTDRKDQKEAINSSKAHITIEEDIMELKEKIKALESALSEKRQQEISEDK